MFYDNFQAHQQHQQLGALRADGQSGNDSTPGRSRWSSINVMGFSFLLRPLLSLLRAGEQLFSSGRYFVANYYRIKVNQLIDVFILSLRAFGPPAV